MSSATLVTVLRVIDIYQPVICRVSALSQALVTAAKVLGTMRTNVGNVLTDVRSATMVCASSARVVTISSRTSIFV